MLEALVGKQTAFARTPKYRVESKKDKVGANKYRDAWAGCPGSNLLIGSYFALTVYYAVANENYITVPFLLSVRARLLVHGIDVSAAGPLRGLVSERGDAYQAVSRGRVGGTDLGPCRKRDGAGFAYVRARPARPSDGRDDSPVAKLSLNPGSDFRLSFPFVALGLESVPFRALSGAVPSAAPRRIRCATSRYLPEYVFGILLVFLVSCGTAHDSG